MTGELKPTREETEQYLKAEPFGHGNMGCPGCGEPIAMRLVLNALENKAVIVIPACCGSIIDGLFPYSCAKVPVLHTPFPAAASTSSGVLAALRRKGRDDITVVAWAGDGGTYDIGIQALSSAVERNDDFLYICYDNEAYMNTGIQRSSSTPLLAWTTTTPAGHPKEVQKKNMIEILAAHYIPYAASATVSFPEDLVAKVRKARAICGSKYINILSPCPTGWKIKPEMSIKVARLAVTTNVYPLYEIFDGRRLVLRDNPDPKPVEEYLEAQGRFRHLDEKDVRQIQDNVDREWEYLRKRAAEIV
ncbi:MAG: thiamine pyrophosphate-dependent enzyme [Gemmatimonadota bacterium]|nr:thiamine pyrophosphate-dependent enzyme [Gemmatimonadota bacterium]